MARFSVWVLASAVLMILLFTSFEFTNGEDLMSMQIELLQFAEIVIMEWSLQDVIMPANGVTQSLPQSPHSGEPITKSEGIKKVQDLRRLEGFKKHSMKTSQYDAGLKLKLSRIEHVRYFTVPRIGMEVTYSTVSALQKMNRALERRLNF